MCLSHACLALTLTTCLGQYQLEGHHILCGYGDGSLQLYSVFDWTFQYRIPRAHEAAITSILQLPGGIVVTASCDGVFKVLVSCVGGYRHRDGSAGS